MDNTSFIMIHNCWTYAQGDSNELRKQADVMDTMNDVMMTFYKSKFGLSEEELKSMMDAETWFSGSEAKNFKLDCEVVESETEYKIAASIGKRFKNIPKRILDMRNKAEETLKEEIIEEVTEKKEEQKLSPDEEKKVEEVVEEITKDETTDQPEEEVKEEEVKEPTLDELKEENESLKVRIAELEAALAECQKKSEVVEEEKEEKEEEETISKAECEKRVSGM